MNMNLLVEINNISSHLILLNVHINTNINIFLYAIIHKYKHKYTNNFRGQNPANTRFLNFNYLILKVKSRKNTSIDYFFDNQYKC